SRNITIQSFRERDAFAPVGRSHEMAFELRLAVTSEFPAHVLVREFVFYPVEVRQEMLVRKQMLLELTLLFQREVAEQVTLDKPLVVVWRFHINLPSAVALTPS